MLALRNAWVAYFQESKISQLLVNEFRLVKTNVVVTEIAMDYVVLTSSKWSAHSSMHGMAGDYISGAEALDHQQWEVWAETQDMEKDEINSRIDEFRIQKQKSYTSLLERNADYARHDIRLAKMKIYELHLGLRDEVNKQKVIIEDATSPIRTFQNHVKTLEKKAPGRPKKISERHDKQQRRQEASEFVSQWVSSLMSTLSITSSDELPRIVGGSKATWWRWLNKKNLNLPNSLEPLLDMKIKKGDVLPGTKLCDVQTTPKLRQLIDLVNLV